MAADHLLVVERLRVAFDNGRNPVLRDVGFEIAPGEAFGLVGESGSGKSMTCRAILGLLPRGAAISGRVALGDDELLDLPERALRALRGRRIAMVFQDPMSALNPVLRVGAAIGQVIRSHEAVDGATTRRRAIELMDRVGIHDAARRASAYPHEFSGGMRQRIVIAMALAARPSLLLADEPTTALDVIVQAGILRLLDRLRREDGMSLLLVSHDLGVVAGVCDRVAVMYAGELVEEGPTAKVLFDAHMPYTIGLIDSVPGRGAGARLRSISGTPPQPGELAPGCAFAPRCPLAAEVCRGAPIPPVAVAPGHWARCVRTDQLAGLRPAPPTPAARHG